jgi:uncharacterized surface protein with fasciclin (FAS1) repeats
MTRNLIAASVMAAVALVGHLGAQPAAAQNAAEKDIVETAVAAGQFKTLVKAVQAAGLVDTLQGEGPFTVFAPTDEAFAAIPAEKLQALLADKKALTAVLTYHVVPGKVTSREVVKLDSAKTVQGQPVKIEASGGEVRVNGAKVIKADIACSNGVIHVIDSVLLPPKSASASAK